MAGLDLQSNPVNEILYISFNQDQSCFVVGTESGFRVYNTDPFRLTFRRDFEGAGGLGVVAMLFRSNILALVGGGRNPRFQPHKVMLWDDKHPRCIAELSFRSAVKAVRLRRDVVVVVIDRKLYIYRFTDLLLIDHVETISNPKGLCCLSSAADRIALVCPGMQKGRLLVIFYDPQKAMRAQQSSDSSDNQLALQKELQASREKTTIIAAHEAVVAAMSMNFDGTFLASASDKGTIIRIYETATGTLVQELRRGIDRAEIHMLSFNLTSTLLACSSDKGTVHLFNLRLDGSQTGGPRGEGDLAVTGEDGAKSGQGRSDSFDLAGAGASSSATPNRISSLRFLSRVLPSYFSSEWSTAQFRVPDYRCSVAFGCEENTLVVVCANGSYYKARFDPRGGGEMVRVGYAQFDDASREADEPPANSRPLDDAPTDPDGAQQAAAE